MISAPRDDWEAHEALPLEDEASPPPGVEAAAVDPQALLATINRLREESDQRLTGWQRAQADFENLKRRSAQDVRERVEQSQRAIFESLADLADDFQRALEDEQAETAAAEWRAGLGLIQQKLIGLLERNRVHPIAAVGVAFDPNYHESMGWLEGPKDSVVAEVQRGWMIGERVLRASRVMVGKGLPADSEPPETASGGTADETAGESTGAADQGA